jgi:drug/metabolite transporter (DMT)-like permease
MSWLTLTIIAQFLNSIVAVFDKYLVTSKRVTTPILYVFFTGILTCLGIIVYLPSLYFTESILPRFSDVSLVGPGVFALLICAGIAQLLALWALFSSLKRNDASDVVPVIGSLSAVFALIIGYLFLGVVLPAHFVVGFGLLVFGTFLISHLRFSLKTFWFTLLGGAGFALYSILLKEVLLLTSFETGFFWISIITTLLSLCLLFFPQLRRTFHSQRKEKHIKVTGLVMFGNKLIAGIAGILLIKAIEVGEVSLVQALGGIQFVFLFLIAVIFGPITPIDFGENVKRKDVYSKLAAISIIFVGFVLLFI